MLVERVPDPEGVRAEGVGVNSEADLGGETEEGGGAVVVTPVGEEGQWWFSCLFFIFVCFWWVGEVERGCRTGFFVELAGRGSAC